MDRTEKQQKLGELKLRKWDMAPSLIATIPYLPGGDLGKAYNQIMERAEDWVLFMDQDLFLLNPNWYEICLRAIKLYGKEAAWITCRTNRIGRTEQRLLNAPKSNDIDEHRRMALKVWRENLMSMTDITDLPPGHLASGFFMLTNRRVWMEVGGFKEGFLGVDNDYHVKIREAGYRLIRLGGLYVYHHYSRDWFWPDIES